MPERMSISAASVIAPNRGSRAASSGAKWVIGSSSPASRCSATARASTSDVTVFEIENAVASRSLRPPLPYHSHAIAPSCTATMASAPPSFSQRSSAGSFARTGPQSAASRQRTGAGAGVTRAARFHSWSLVLDSRCHSTRTR